MALQAQVVDLPPASGTSEDGGKYVPTSGFHQLDNWVFSRTGELVKRAGYGLLPTARIGSGALPPPDRVMVRGDELVMVGDDQGLEAPMPALFSYSRTLGQWAPRGPAVGVSVTRRRPLARPPSDGLDQAPQVAHAVGMECRAWLSGGVTTVEIVDATTGTVAFGGPLAIPGKAVLLVTNGLFRFVWLNGVNLQTFTISPSTLTIGAVTTVTAVGASTVYWDACATTGGAWVWAGVRSGGAVIDVQRVTGSTAGAAATITGLTSSRCALAWAGSVVLLAYDSAGDIRARTYVESTLAAGVAPWTVRPTASYLQLLALGCVVAADGTLLVASTTTVTSALFGSPPFCSWFDAFSATGTTLGAPLPQVWHVALGSRPFVGPGGGGVTYCLVHGDPAPPGGSVTRSFGYALLNLTRGRASWHPQTSPILVEASLAPHDGRGLFVQATGISCGAHLTLPSVQSSIFAPLVVFRGGDSLVGSRSAVADLVELSTYAGAEALGTTVEVQRELLQGGALPTLYDGLSTVEAAFLQPPEIVGASYVYDTTFGPEPAPGPLGNVYQYVAHYQRRDRQGQVHRSRPSDPVTLTIIGTGTGAQAHAIVTLTLRTTALSRHPTDEVQIVVYRTLKNAAGSHYELRDYSASTLLLNNPSLPAVQVSDSQSDANLLAIARPQLYTDGGVLAVDAPPPFRHVARHGNRAWGVSAEAPEVWFSRTLIDGEAPCWSLVNRVTLDDSDSEPVATAGQDGTTLIWTRTQTYAVQGDGPNDAGGGGFLPPSRLQVARGCVDARSVVPWRGGTGFQAPEGLVMLSRKLELVPFGRPVERTVGASVEFGGTFAALHDPARDRLLWILAGDGATRAAVYDCTLDAWTTWTWDGQNVRGQALWRGQHVLVHGDGVAVESTGATPGYDPGARWVTSSLWSPWLRLGALGGYERLWRIHLQLEASSSYGLVWTLYVDGNDQVAAQTETWTPAQLDALSTSPRNPLTIGIAPQKSATFQFRLADSGPTDDGPASSVAVGPTYHGASLQIGAKKGLYKGPKDNLR